MELELTRRGFVAAAGTLMAAGAFGLAGCSSSGTSTDVQEEPADTSEETVETTEETADTAAVEKEEVDNTVTYDDVNIEVATADEVKAILDGNDTATILIDARPQECYAGWALEGAANGGHLKGAKLFSRRWLDCDYARQIPRADVLDRAMNDQGIADASAVIVYDYTGKQAVEVAKYLVSKGVASVKSFQANEIIDGGSHLESYENYQRFVPTELVKSVSDVKSGKADELSDEAKAVFGDDTDKIVLVDVGWGNAKGSSYLLTGHVPGSIHINTDCYERPRVYVPEKRSEYAKEWRLIPLEEFRDELMPEYGITKDSIVIATGAATSPQGRLGFMLRSLGVEYYAMVGLLTAWKYNGYELDTDESTVVVPTAAESFGSDEIPNPGEILWMEDIKKILAGEIDGQVVDNRVDEEWNGEYSGYGYHDLAGRIEGTLHCDIDIENPDSSPRTQAEMKAFMESCDVDTSKTAAFFCGDSWGAAGISYWCQSVDMPNIMQWGNGWIPWSNEGNEFVDHNGNKVHYDKWLDTVIDADGNDMRDGVNILDDAAPEEE